MALLDFHAKWYYSIFGMTISIPEQSKITGLDFFKTLDNKEQVRTGRMTIEDGRLVWSPDTEPSVISLVNELNISADPENDPEAFLHYVWLFIRSPYFYAARIEAG